MMMDRQVIFYSIIGDFREVSAKLCEKLYNANSDKILFLCKDEESIKEIDSKLWTSSKLSFLPHGSKFSVPVSEAEYCSIWVSNKIEHINNPTCLLHNGITVAANEISCFSNIIDIFAKGQENEALKRSELYRLAMFNDQKVWVQGTHGWQKSESLC
jgi:DNA polymerase IIIc chi subunit